MTSARSKKETNERERESNSLMDDTYDHRQSGRAHLADLFRKELLSLCVSLVEDYRSFNKISGVQILHFSLKMLELSELERFKEVRIVFHHRMIIVPTADRG